MKMSNDKVAIIPFEPQVHAPLVYRWYHSGEYGLLFDNLPMFTISKCMTLNNAYMIVNPKDPQEVFGIIVLDNIDERNRNMTVNAMVVKEHQNKGLVKEAMKFMTYYIMNNMNFYKIIGHIREDNLASDKASKAFGFEQEGLLKHQVYVDGEFYNIKRVYMTKGMFNKKYKQAMESEAKGANL